MNGLIKPRAAAWRVWPILLLCLALGSGCYDNDVADTSNMRQSLSISPPQSAAIGSATRIFSASPAYGVRYFFTNRDTSKSPAGPLTPLSSGNLVGGALENSSYDGGSLFKFNGTAVQTLSTFRGGSYAPGGPEAGVVVAPSGTIYGTLFIGGYASGDCYEPCGVLYSLKHVGPSWQFTVLHNFTGSSNDGALPEGPPLLVNGTLYGTASEGGSGCRQSEQFSGCGVLYQIAQNGTNYQVLYHFANAAVAEYPSGPLLYDGNGNLYGTTQNNMGFLSPRLRKRNSTGETCTAVCGTIYKFNIASKAFSVLHTFSGSDGAYPTSGVVLANGILYGTTPAGGPYDCIDTQEVDQGCGVLFDLPLSNVLPLSVLHYFNPGLQNMQPLPSGLTQASDGNFYGTTENGGSCCGTVFSMSPSGLYATLHNFQPGATDGGGPYDPWTPSLTADQTGILWGDTQHGGGCCGVVYSLTFGGDTVRKPIKRMR